MYRALVVAVLDVRKIRADPPILALTVGEAGYVFACLGVLQVYNVCPGVESDNVLAVGRGELLAGGAPDRVILASRSLDRGIALRGVPGAERTHGEQGNNIRACLPGVQV